MHRAAQAGAAGVVGAARHVTAVPDSELATFSTLLTTSHEAMRRSYASGSTHRPHMEHGTNDNGRSSGSVVEASSPGGTACEANIPHMEHRTPRGVASTHPICLTTPEAAEKGGFSGAAGAQSRSKPEAADTATPGAGRRVYITFRDTAKGSDARLNSVAHEQCSLAPTPSRHSASSSCVRRSIQPACFISGNTYLGSRYGTASLLQLLPMPDSSVELNVTRS